MNHFHPIDLYCERTAPGFWNEPVNALSNLAFLFAAFWALSLWRRHGRKSMLDLLLILLAAAIGIGSFLFHTFANGWAELADVVPIWSFVALYVLVIIYRQTGEDPAKTLRIAAITAVCVGVSVWFTSGDITTGQQSGPSPFNGSLQYVPALMALTAFAVISWTTGHPARHLVGAAALSFVMSLVFRTIDLDLCDSFPLGSHFLWHLLNGLMVGILLVALLRHFPPGGRRA